MTNNWVNTLQEYLQAYNPSLGCRPEELWRYDEPAIWSAHSKVRTLLINQTHGGNRNMKWSAPHMKRKPARQDAAKRAYEELKASRHLPCASGSLPLAVPISHMSLNQGQARPPANTTGPRLELPLFPADMMEIEAVVCIARSAGVKITADQGSRDLAFQFEEDNEARSNGSTKKGKISEHIHLTQGNDTNNNELAFSLPPANLGELGEQFAVQWLNQQHHSAASSPPSSSYVRWMNGDGDQQLDHDIEYDIVYAATAGHGDAPATRTIHIEVKTRWRRCQAKMSARQLRRLLDPSEDYALLVVGDFKNVFDVDTVFGLPSPSAPRIRILHSCADHMGMGMGMAEVGVGAGWAKKKKQKQKNEEDDREGDNDNSHSPKMGMPAREQNDQEWPLLLACMSGQVVHTQPSVKSTSWARIAQSKTSQLGAGSRANSKWQ
jgi:hypothetical protein